MVVETAIDIQTGVLMRTVRGAISFEEFTRVIEETLVHPDFRPGMDSIWDLRQADLTNLTREDMRRIVEYIERQDETRGTGYKAALVVSREVDYGFTRMYKTYADGLPVRLDIFRSLEEARAWLFE